MATKYASLKAKRILSHAWKYLTGDPRETDAQAIIRLKLHAVTTEHRDEHTGHGMYQKGRSVAHWCGDCRRYLDAAKVRANHD